MKLYQSGQIDAVTAMKMMAEASQAAVSPSSSPATTGTPPVPAVVTPASDGHKKRPHPEEDGDDKDDDSDDFNLDEKQYNHLDSHLTLTWF